MNANEKMQLQDGSGNVDEKQYGNLISGLNYLVHTRPDISFSVSMVSRYMSNPTKFHYAMVKRILCYIAGSIEFRLWYSKSSNFKLVAFTDSDWAGSLDDRRSTSRIVFMLGSSAVTWSSRKHSITALSSIEAKYVDATSSVCQAIWLKRLLEDMGHLQDEAIEILCDNRPGIYITKNPTMHGRTKHVDIRFHFIRGLVADGKIIVKHCISDEQLAFLFTKSLPIN